MENESKASLDRPDEDDEIMREAAAALAETESVLKTRKDALIAKHVEGRESLHELDYIFRDNRDDGQQLQHDSMPTGGKAGGATGVGGFQNYLDQHNDEIEHYKTLVDESRRIGEGLTSAKAREGLFEWSSRVDKELGLEAERDDKERRPAHHGGNGSTNDALSLELDTHQTGRHPPRKIHNNEMPDAANARERSPGRQRSFPDPTSTSGQVHSALEDDGQDFVKQERDRMLELIRQNKKAKFEEGKEKGPEPQNRDLAQH